MLARNVVRRAGARFAGGDSDDRQCRVFCRIGHLALQRFEPAADYIGFAQAELAGQPVQAAALRAVEVNLDWLGDARRSLIMSLTHDLMILYHDIFASPSGAVELLTKGPRDEKSSSRGSR